MAQHHIHAFDALDTGAIGIGAQCFDGFSNQDRIDVAAGAVWPNAPHFIVSPDGPAANYVVVYLTAPALVFCGPALANNAADVVQWQARAVAYGPGWWPMIARPGYIVAIKEL